MRAPVCLRARSRHATSRRHVDLAHQVEVRRAGPARGHALGHDPPDRRRRRAALGRRWGAGSGAGPGRRPRRGAARARRRPAPRRPAPSRAARAGRSPRSAASRRALGDAATSAPPAAPLPAAAPSLALDVGEHVGLLDLPLAVLTCGEVDAVLLGDLAGEGRGLRRARRGGAAGAADGRGGGRSPGPLRAPPGRGAAPRRLRRRAKIRAMVWPTGTTSPSCAVTSRRTPEAGASISTVTLSVSISTIGSPLRDRVARAP